MLSEADLETTAERRLWNAIESGEPVDAEDEAEDERAVRAQLLVELVTTAQRPTGNRPRALRLSTAHITGELDLSGLTLECPLEVVDSDFDAAVSLDDAEVDTLNLSACRIPGLSADQIETRRDLILNEIKTSEVSLVGARIGATLMLMGAELRAAGGTALFADRLEVRGSVFINGLDAEGEIRLVGARVGRQVVVADARLENTDGLALNMSDATVGGGVFASELHARGEVRLLAANVTGEIDFSDAVLDNSGGIALACDNGSSSRGCTRSTRCSRSSRSDRRPRGGRPGTRCTGTCSAC
jgi:hypothetical protein